MKNNEDSFITNQEFIDFLSFDELGNMTDLSWNASSTTNLSLISISTLSLGHDDIKKSTIERLVKSLYNSNYLEKEIPQEYKGPIGINKVILDSYTIKAKKLYEFINSKKNMKPQKFFKYFKMIDEFLYYCSPRLNKLPSNINDLDLTDMNLFNNFITVKKLSKSKVKDFEKIFVLYFSKGNLIYPINKENTETFNHVVIERHLEEVKKECTIESYHRKKRDYKNFLTWLTTIYVEFQSYTINSIPLFLITENHLEEYKIFLFRQFQNGKYKKHYISDMFYNVRSLFGSLYQMRAIPNDITISVKGIKFEKYKYRDLPNNQHLNEFFDSVMCYTPEPLQFCTAYKLMLYLGLRLGEVAYIESSNINFNTNTISVKGKDDKYDLLPLPEILLEDLYSLIAFNQKYIFSNKPHSFKTDLYLYYKLLSFILDWNFPGGVHIFRHTFITRLSKLPNIRPQVIQYLSRHSRPETTSLYIHRNDNSLNSAINKIDYFKGE